jgi:hypothetical protein
VELRGFEPLTFCMPCMMVSSDDIALGLITAVQSGFGVCGRLARSGEIWGRWSLVWYWFAGSPSQEGLNPGTPDHSRHHNSGDRRSRRATARFREHAAADGSGAWIHVALSDSGAAVTDRLTRHWSMRLEDVAMTSTAM